MAIDTSGIAYFLPLLAFLLVFIVSFTVIYKTKITEVLFLQLAISILVATIFVTAIGATNLVLNIVPWFAVLLVCLFMILALTGFIGDDMKFIRKPIGVIVVILLVIVFLVSALFVFSTSLGPYLPGSTAPGGDPDVLFFTDWLYSPGISGALLVFGVGLIVAWIMVRSIKDKK